MEKFRTTHIAVMSQPFLDYVLNGQKTVESRFSFHKVAPYEKVNPDDIIYMKAGPIIGCFTAEWVKYFDLHEHSIKKLRQTYGDVICGDEEFWQQKASKRYVTLIGIKNVKKLPPVAFSKRDRRGWLSFPPGSVTIEQDEARN